MSSWPQLGSCFQRSKGPMVADWTVRSSFLFSLFTLFGCPLVVMNEHIVCWNFRGLNRRARQSAVRELA
jgi:hypothetical protein